LCRSADQWRTVDIMTAVSESRPLAGADDTASAVQRSPSPLRAARITTGGDYLERRSALARQLSEQQTFKSITILDDVQFDADVLAGTPRRVLGREIAINTARSLMALHKLWETGLPDLVFMDDRLGHMGNATGHIPALRKLGYLSPIVVVSGMMSRERRAQVMQLGAANMLHKDDLDTLTVMELLVKLLDSADGSAGDAA
jgi:CheY-like chemotaxis protein